MIRILSTTAIALALATPVTAAGGDTADWSTTFQDVAAENDIHASDFIGSRVYVSKEDVAADKTMNDPDENWDDVGEINDVLMTRDGQVEAILVDVGGFLGMGEKTVAVQMDRLHLVSDGDDPDDYFVVFTSSRDALENAPEFDKDADRAGTMSDTDKRAAKTSDDATKPGKTETAAQGQDDSVTGKASMSRTDEMPPEDERAMGTYPAAPKVSMEGYDTIATGDLKADELTGATVYGVDDDNIGEISDIIVNTDGQVTDAVIDVGGFLGIGEKPVKVSFDSLTVKRRGDDGDLRVYIDATEEQLKDLPEYEG